jgi:DNA polymerase
LASVQTRLVQAGAPVIFSVHDELVLELGNDRPGTHDILCKAMCKLPAWADGLPIAAAGWTGQRYRK